MTRNYAQTKCHWCRKHLGVGHSSCLDIETKHELLAYIKANGRTWRSKLSAEWMSGSSVLRQLRNIAGPSGLAGVRPTDFDVEVV